MHMKQKQRIADLERQLSEARAEVKDSESMKNALLRAINLIAEDVGVDPQPFNTEDTGVIGMMNYGCEVRKKVKQAGAAALHAFGDKLWARANEMTDIRDELYTKSASSQAHDEAARLQEEG